MTRVVVTDDENALEHGYLRPVQPLRTFLARRGGPLSVDGVVAVVACIACELELALSDNIEGPAWVNAVAAAGVTLPVAWRRPFPLAAPLVMIAFITGQEALNGDLIENTVTPVVTLPLAMYSMGVLLDRRRALLGFGVAQVLTWIAVILQMDRTVDGLIFALMLIGGPFLVGRIVNARMELAAHLREKAARLERDQQERARLAVAEERARIAREMHDVVAHNLSVMVVQSSAAKRMISRNPERASEALASVEKTGREALAEMRRMLDMLRGDEEKAALAPQPSIDQLDTLLDRAREAGLDVDLEVEGERRRVQSSVDLSCFRIVQEALSNTIEHADAEHAHVRLRYGREAVEVDVTDDGRGVPARDPDNGRGHGLLGMRERVAMLGGSLEAGYRAGGGFEVRATLPLEPEER
jgi:signal transduction histidine kinase